MCEAGTEPASTSAVRVADVRFEHHREPLGIGEAAPRLSWTVETDAGWRQAAYEVEARGDRPAGTKRVESDESVLVPWPFLPLASRERVEVRVRVWGADGGESDWSEWRAAEAGLLGSSDWSARFVTPDWDEDASRPQPSPRDRLPAMSARPTRYATAGSSRP